MGDKKEKKLSDKMVSALNGAEPGEFTKRAEYMANLSALASGLNRY